MQVSPEIDYKGIQVTPEIEELVTKQIERLEKVCNYIISLHVAIEREQGRHQAGNPYRVRLDIRVPPNHEMVVKRSSVIHADARPQPEPDEALIKYSAITSRKDEPLPGVIRRAFDSARRQLERFVERQRGEIKAHSQNGVMAFVHKIFRNEGYGFLRTLDGRQIYFHKNAALHGQWDKLGVGTGVRFTEQEGEEGPQASSVEIMDKPGVSEMHDVLHALPSVAEIRKGKLKMPGIPNS